MADAGTIDEVIAALDGIIATALADRSRLGLFAALYRQVTLRVRQRIAEGYFADGPRMARLDTAFANRYLTALATWRAGGAPSQCWQFAFDATRRSDLLIVQHLLLGINAHINLDLGVAAAAVAPGPALPLLHDDFDRINQILAALTAEVKQVVARFSPMLYLIDELCTTAEDAVVNFSMSRARRDAWQHAELLVAQAPGQEAPAIDLFDTKATFLGRLVAEPGRLLTAALDAVHLAESKDLRAIITALNAMT